MKRVIYVEIYDDNWPYMNLLLWTGLDREIAARVGPGAFMISRQSLFDTAIPNMEVHLSNALRQAVSSILRDRRDYGPSTPAVQTEGRESHARVQSRNPAQRQQTRTKSQKPKAGNRDRAKLRKKIGAKGSAKKAKVGRR
jgi:hypothetical protein